MKLIVTNILAVIIGLFVGSVVNMGLITVGPLLIPPPEGADTTTYEGLKTSMPLFTVKHFLFPFLAHAAGTLVGAIVAFFIASSHKIMIAYAIGFLFLIGGLVSILNLLTILTGKLMSLAYHTIFTTGSVTMPQKDETQTLAWESFDNE